MLRLEVGQTYTHPEPYLVTRELIMSIAGKLQIPAEQSLHTHPVYAARSTFQKPGEARLFLPGNATLLALDFAIFQSLDLSEHEVIAAMLKKVRFPKPVPEESELLTTFTVKSVQSRDDATWAELQFVIKDCPARGEETKATGFWLVKFQPITRRGATGNAAEAEAPS